MDVQPRQTNSSPLNAARSKAPVKSRVPAMKIVSERQTSPIVQGKDKLILNRKEITSIEKIVFGFTSVSEIQVLDLSMNLITVIPECLAGMHSLKKLDLSQNFISTFGSTLSKIKTLVRLNLAKNKIARIGSSDIYQLFFAKTVIVSHNLISEITPNIRHLVNLKVFYLDGNPISSLPISLKELKNLKELKIEWPEYLFPPRLPSIPSQEFIPNKQDEIDEKEESPNRWISLEELWSYLHSLESIKKASSFTLLDLHKGFSSDAIVNTYEHLCQAIRMNHPGVALFLLDDPLRGSLNDSQLRELLLFSLRCPVKTIAKRLLELGAPCNIKINKQQESLLHWAADVMSDELLQTLKKRLEKTDLLDEQGNSSLHKLFQKKNERDSFFNFEFQNNKKIFGTSKDYLTPMCMQDAPLGVLSRDEILSSSGPSKERDIYYSEFYKKLAEIAVQLIDMGVDPNHFNAAGMCAWHLLVIRENYITFKLLRICDLTGPKAIDWSLGLDKGEIPVLHLVAACKDWRFFLEYLEGKSKVNSIELDSQLRLPDKVLSEHRYLLRVKIYLRHLHSDYRLLLKFQNCLEDANKSRLKRKASLLKKTQGDEGSISQKSRTSYESSGIKKLHPSIQIGPKLTRFSPSKPETFDHIEDQSANKIMTMHPKSGYLKFAAPKSIDRLDKPSSNIGLNIFSLQNSKSLQQEDHSSELLSTSNNKATITWLEGAVTNLKFTTNNPKIVLNVDSMKSNLLKKKVVQKESTIKHEAGPIKGSSSLQFTTKVPSRIHQIPHSDLSENVQVNKSRQIEVSVNMSQLNSVRSLQSSQQVDKEESVPKFLKVFTKIMLRDLINFRYSCSKLSIHIQETQQEKQEILLYYLMNLKNFLGKVRVLVSGLSTCLKSELVPSFISSVKEELMHDDCLLKIKSLLQENFEGKKSYFLRKRSYLMLSISEEILDTISQMFGSDLQTNPRVRMPPSLASTSISTRKTNNFTKGSSNIFLKAITFSPEKKHPSMNRKEMKEILLSPGDLRLDGSSDSSGESLNLNVQNLTAPFEMEYKVDLSDLKEKFKQNKPQLNQLPLNRLISDHDKGLKSLESKIISFKTHINSMNGTEYAQISKQDLTKCQGNRDFPPGISTGMFPSRMPRQKIL